MKSFKFMLLPKTSPKADMLDHSANEFLRYPIRYQAWAYHNEKTTVLFEGNRKEFSFRVQPGAVCLRDGWTQLPWGGSSCVSENFQLVP